MTTVPAENPSRPVRPVVRRGPIDIDYLRTHPTCSVEQAAQLIGVSREYGYVLIRSGMLDAIELGERRVRVKSAALLRLLGVED